MDQLTELAYSKWAGHYSQRHWVSNEPLWNQLKEEDQKFWKEFIQGVINKFKTAEELKPQVSRSAV